MSLDGLKGTTYDAAMSLTDILHTIVRETHELEVLDSYQVFTPTDIKLRSQLVVAAIKLLEATRKTLEAHKRY